MVNNIITDGFPFNKQELGNLCATIELLILNIGKNAVQQHPQNDVHQVIKGYQSLKYPLLVVWEYYGFGDVKEVMGLTSPIYYQAFKMIAEESLREILYGVKTKNPFDFYGVIPNSNKVVDKLILVYSHLLNNLETRRLRIS